MEGTLSGGKPPFLTCIQLSLSYFDEGWVLILLHVAQFSLSWMLCNLSGNHKTTQAESMQVGKDGLPPLSLHKTQPPENCVTKCPTQLSLSDNLVWFTPSGVEGL